MLAGLGALGLLGAAALPAAAAPIDGLTLGQLEPIMPAGEPTGLVFLLSGKDGLTPELMEAADRLARELTVIVAPVDLPAFIGRQSAEDRECLYVVSDIEEVSRRIQKGRGRYLTPIVAGTGMGAALAYAALAQSPDATLDGAASDGFSTRVATTKPLCAGAPVSPAAEGGFSYAPSPLPGWWRVGVPGDALQAAQKFVTAAGAGSKSVIEIARQLGLAERLALLLREPLSQAAGAAKTLADLPVVELPVDKPGRLMAVVYSGDGGWRDIDKDIAGRLQELGVPVVGVDSLRYFWSERTPEQVAADLDLIIDSYTGAWQRPDVLLIGYSFGADALPFAFNRLRPEHQRAVRRLSLLGLSTTADLEIRVGGWLGVGSGAYQIAPELERLPTHIVQCFYGEEEEDTACTTPAMKGAELVRTSGGHHFDGNYEALADRILAGVAAR